jgi:hypothetical protein
VADNERGCGSALGGTLNSAVPHGGLSSGIGHHCLAGQSHQPCPPAEFIESLRSLATQAHALAELSRCGEAIGGYVCRTGRVAVFVASGGLGS